MTPQDQSTHASGSYKISDEGEVARREQERLDALARTLDPVSTDFLSQFGVCDGWRCLEVGGGSGSLARWLAQRAAPAGVVVSTDVDLRFHQPAEGVLEVRQHDITRDPLPDAAFDLTHARGVLQHIPARELALARMVGATRPGGWIVIEDADFTPFLEQDLPEPFGKVARAMAELSTRAQRDGRFGLRVAGLYRQHGLTDITARGHVWTMRGGTDSAEWWVKAMEHTEAILAAVGAATAAEVRAAVAQAREPGFAVLSPLHLAVAGRKP